MECSILKEDRPFSQDKRLLVIASFSHFWLRESPGVQDYVTRFEDNKLKFEICKVFGEPSYNTSGLRDDLNPSLVSCSSRMFSFKKLKPIPKRYRPQLLFELYPRCCFPRGNHVFFLH